MNKGHIKGQNCAVFRLPEAEKRLSVAQNRLLKAYLKDFRDHWGEPADCIVTMAANRRDYVLQMTAAGEDPAVESVVIPVKGVFCPPKRQKRAPKKGDSLPINSSRGKAQRNFGELPEPKPTHHLLTVVEDHNRKPEKELSGAEKWRRGLESRKVARGGNPKPAFISGKGGLTKRELYAKAEVNIDKIKGAGAKKGSRISTKDAGGTIIKQDPLNPKRWRIIEQVTLGRSPVECNLIRAHAEKLSGVKDLEKYKRKLEEFADSIV